MINLYSALDLWAAIDGNRFPHGVHPLAFPGGIIVNMDQAQWDSWQWNPHQNAGLFIEAYREISLHLIDVDESAPDKPTWNELVRLLESAVS